MYIDSVRVCEMKPRLLRKLSFIVRRLSKIGWSAQDTQERGRFESQSAPRAQVQASCGFVDDNFKSKSRLYYSVERCEPMLAHSFVWE